MKLDVVGQVKDFEFLSNVDQYWVNISFFVLIIFNQK
jgi:hypothetical protein